MIVETAFIIIMENLTISQCNFCAIEDCEKVIYK